MERKLLLWASNLRKHSGPFLSGLLVFTGFSVFIVFKYYAVPGILSLRGRAPDPAVPVAGVLAVFSVIGLLLGIMAGAAVISMLGEAIRIPIRKVTAHLTEIARGNFDANLNLDGFGEFTELIAAVDMMTAKLKVSFDEQRSRAIRSESILSAMRDGLLIVDRSGIITTVNDAAGRLLGYGEYELINQPLGKYIPEPGFVSAIQRGEDLSALLNGELKCIIHAKGAEAIPVSLSGAVVSPASPFPVPPDTHIVIVMRDLRAWNDAERKKEDALRYLELAYKNREEEIKAHTTAATQSREAMLNILEDLNEAKDTLEISRKNFLNIVTKSADSILIVGRDGIVYFMNPSAVVLFGRTEKESIGRQFGYAIVQNRTSEINIQRTEHELRVAQVRVVETEWEQQSMYLVLLHDITEQKKAEATLRHSAQEWRSTFDAISDSVSLLDREGRVLRCNKALQRGLNKGFPDIVGHDAHEFLPGTDVVEANCLICRTMTTRKRETKVFSRNKQWLRIAVDPLLEGNDVAGAVHIITDITEQKFIEQKLLEYTAFVESILDTAQAIIVVLDPRGQVLSSNSFAEKLLGYGREEIIGHDWVEGFVPEEHRESVRQVLLNCMHGVPVRGYEHPVRTKNGNNLVISWYNAEQRNSNQEVIGLVVMGYDVTQRKEIEKMQRLAQLGTLVSHMAHEVNNPLMVISGRAQLALMEDIQNGEIKSNLGVIMSECQRAKEIIQRLLKFSRPSKGDLKVVQINQSLDEVIMLLEHQFLINNVQIRKQYAADLPPALVDEKQMHEVFMNLMTNAFDAIVKEGLIQISTAFERERIVIRFKDSGIGMKKETLDKIFDPFFTTKSKGTGLGLSICYSIIKSQQGELVFESEEGKGTTASIYLPYLQSKP